MVLQKVFSINSIIGLISFSAIDKNLKEGRIKTCKAQEKNIIEGAKTYFIDHPNELLDIETKEITITLLETEGYIEENLINPMTDKQYKDGTKVEIKKISDSKYTYKLMYDEMNGDKKCE